MPLVGLDDQSGAGCRTVAVQTGFGAGVQLHDYTRHASDVWTDSGGRATIGLPPGESGRGSLAHSSPPAAGALLLAVWQCAELVAGPVTLPGLSASITRS